ncbi:MAG: GTP 3',8-cyclase MoaA [Coriobacteriaceae bacterium]
MKDSHGRTIDYLRISLTDRCNFRCVYCMPEEGVCAMSHDEILRIEEIERLVAVAAGIGIRSVRLTGGEPLVRKGVVDLVDTITGIEGIENVSMTTNGVLLPRMIDDLKAAGLSRVNISLDTRLDQFHEITRTGHSRPLAGIDAALEVGLIRGERRGRAQLNQDFLEFAKLSIDRPLHVRFASTCPWDTSVDAAGWGKRTSSPLRSCSISSTSGPPPLAAASPTRATNIWAGGRPVTSVPDALGT